MNKEIQSQLSWVGNVAFQVPAGFVDSHSPVVFCVLRGPCLLVAGVTHCCCSYLYMLWADILLRIQAHSACS